MFGIFTRKDRKIANLEAKVKNRDIVIKNLCDTKDVLLSNINDMEDEIQFLKKRNKSIQEDLNSVRQQSFEYANKIKRPNLAKQNKKHLV